MPKKKTKREVPKKTTVHTKNKKQFTPEKHSSHKKQKKKQFTQKTKNKKQKNSSLKKKKQFTQQKNRSHRKTVHTEKTQFMRGREAKRDFFLSRCRWTSQNIRSQDYSRSQVHMSKHRNGCENNNTQAESRIDTKITDTGSGTEFTRLISGFLHTMCSGVAQRNGFIVTNQIVVSQDSTELVHRQDGPRCRPDNPCRPHARKAHHSQQGSTQSGFGIPSHGIRVHSSLDVATQHFCRSVHLTTPSCSSRSRSIHGSLLLPMQPRGESSPPSMSSKPLVAEGVFPSRASSFA